MTNSNHTQHDQGQMVKTEGYYRLTNLTLNKLEELGLLTKGGEVVDTSTTDVRKEYTSINGSRIHMTAISGIVFSTVEDNLKDDTLKLGNDEWVTATVDNLVELVRPHLKN